MQNIYKTLRIQWRIIKDSYWHLNKNLRDNASIRTDQNKLKMQYTILRENHVIEKGMSMKNVKQGFGVEKVYCLIKRLEKYYEKYHNFDNDFLQYPISTIDNYIDYTNKTSLVDISKIEKRISKLKSLISPFPIIQSGFTVVTKDEIENAAKKDFKSLLYSRHSIRYFASQPSVEELEEALTLASRTPSACNRQSWRTYIYNKEKCQEIIRWQGGARGFENDIPCCIIVTSNLNAFLEYEIFQAYIDGGMYAQNLINSLHYLGIGSIPLSLGFHYNKLNQLSQWGIPKNEVPIMVIGCGKLLPQFKVAVSTRIDIAKTNTFYF